MNVLHIVDEPYDSGIVQYALKAAHGLARLGHRASLWGLEGCYPVLEARRLGLDSFGYKHPWLNLGSLRRRLIETGADLLVAHTGSAHTLAVAAAAWHREKNLPVIRTRGDARPVRRRPGRRLLWKRTRAFIAANDNILADHRRCFGGVPALAARIYEGAADPGTPAPLPGGAVTVGIVGRLDPVKGHAYFLEAAALVSADYPEARFLVVGRQENVRTGDLLEKAQSLAIAERVEFAGHVPDVYDYIRRCHVGVIASIASEAVSRTAVEWMAAGRPLVATRVGCLPEYVEDGLTGRLVPPRDSGALAAALKGLVSDCYLRERAAAAARRRYLDLFTLESFLDSTRRLYEDAIAAVPSR